jgi:hypothetical protein
MHQLNVQQGSWSNPKVLNWQIEGDVECSRLAHICRVYYLVAVTRGRGSLVRNALDMT